MNEKAKLSQLIEQFEQSNFQDEQLKEQIRLIAKTEVDWDLVQGYYRSMSLENLCDILLMPDIENWQTLNRNECLLLIQEILNDFCNIAIVQRNMNALEKRYPNCSICDLIFWQDYNNAETILAILENS